MQLRERIRAPPLADDAVPEVLPAPREGLGLLAVLHVAQLRGEHVSSAQAGASSEQREKSTGARPLQLTHSGKPRVDYPTIKRLLIHILIELGAMNLKYYANAMR